MPSFLPNLQPSLLPDFVRGIHKWRCLNDVARQPSPFIRTDLNPKLFTSTVFCPNFLGKSEGGSETRA